MRVPVYDAPQVAQAALPEVRSHLDVSNGLDAVGEGIARAGAGVAHVGQEVQLAQQKADVAAATGAINQWQNQALDLEHGTADGSAKGFFQAQGDDAVAKSVPTIQALQKNQQELAGKLANDTQRKLFLAHTNELLLAHRRGIEEYTGRQIQAVQNERANALADTAVRTAAANYADDHMVVVANQSARDALAAAMHGEAPEAIQAALDKLNQQSAVARVKAAVDAGDLAGAERLLYGTHTEAPQPTGDAAADALAVKAHALAQQTNPDRPGIADQLGAARPELEKVVGTLKAQQLGQQNAQRARDLAYDDNSGLVDVAKLDDILQSVPADQRTPQFQEAMAAQRARAVKSNDTLRAQAYQVAYEAYARGGKDLNAVPAQVRSWLVSNDGDGWEKLKAVARRDAEANGRGLTGADPAQTAALNEVRMDMVRNKAKYEQMSPAEFAREWQPRLSTQGFKEMGEMHAKVVADSLRPDAPLPTQVYASVANVAANAFGEKSRSGLPRSPSTWSAEHHQLFDAVVNDIQQQNRAWKAAHGGQSLPPEEMEKRANALFVSGTVKGSGFLGLFGDKETVIEARQKGDVLVDEDGKPISTDGTAATAPASAANLNLDTAPAPGKSVVSYRYNKSRSMRIPVYEDGTQGAPEAAQ